MKILFVSMVPLEYNTSATIQNKGIIRGLSALGHDIDIMTLRPDENAIGFDENMNDISQLIRQTYYIEINSKYEKLMAKKQYSNGKESTKHHNTNISKMIFRGGRNLLKKIYDNVSIFDAQKANVKGVSKLVIDYNNYDIIISASDPKSSHLIVDRILKENMLYDTKWIQYWGDPMFNDITRKRDWRDPVVKYYEKKLLMKADRIIYASPLTLEIQKKTFPEFAYKMDYANQVYANIKDCGIKKSSDVSISVGYFGAYNSAVRDIMPLYNAAKGGDIKLHISGPSDLSLPDTENITIYGKLSYKEVTMLEEESDILVCICNKTGTQIPGKIYYCAGYNKPIIVVLDGEYKEALRTYFQSFNRFILCDNNEDSIINAIKVAKEQLNRKDFEVSHKLTPEYMARKILGMIK